MEPYPPLQPMVPEPSKGGRFRANPLVEHLLQCAEAGQKCDLNDLARVPASAEDRQQFAMLIGYSLSGFLELSYVSDEMAERAVALAESEGFVTHEPGKRWWWEA